MMLAIGELSVSFNSVQVLWDVSFNVEEGEIIALVGANAAGKTTILKTIAGLVSPYQGSVVFDGRLMAGKKPYQIVADGLCLVPEGRRLFPDMSVKENLELGAYGGKVWGERGQSLENVYLVFPILRERGSQLARTLSGGEQQMVAIARGLMSKPRLLMLDEPSLGLSPLNVRELFRVVQALRSSGTTVLLVEQNVQQTLTIADRGYVLENGRIVLSGTGSELLRDAHVRAAYLGS
jgi:branched-chain amino acid transport system ATP-binding protein